MDQFSYDGKNQPVRAYLFQCEDIGQGMSFYKDGFMIYNPFSKSFKCRSYREMIGCLKKIYNIKKLRNHEIGWPHVTHKYYCYFQLLSPKMKGKI